MTNNKLSLADLVFADTLFKSSDKVTKRNSTVIMITINTTIALR